MSQPERHMAFDEAERFLQEITPAGLAKIGKGQFKLPNNWVKTYDSY